jgi:RNA polymerase sigma-70 factor (ECF subfamily)
LSAIEVFSAVAHIPSGMERARAQPAAIPVEKPASFDEIYRTWFRDVVRWARALGGPTSDLDDLAQEVFVVVQRKLPAFDGRNLPAWLFRITARTVSDQRRRAWFRNLWRGPRDATLARLAAVGDDPCAELDRKRRQETLYRILARISEKRRTVFVLYEVEELSGEEIARLLEIPLATVWTRLYHARKELARLAAEEAVR